MSNISAGWYDDGSGRQRWWDGELWTDQFADQTAAPTEVATTRAGAKAMAMASSIKEKLTAEPQEVPGTLWAATGKPLTGLGVGRYRLSDKYLYFEKGTLSLKAQQIPVHDIFDVDSAQTMAQKVRGVGTVTLSAKRPTGHERVLLEDIPNFREGVTIINETAHAARLAINLRENTQTIHYSGAAPATHGVAQAVAPQGPAASVDLNSELTRLADFHKQGILTDEEFSAAKRKLLGL